MFPGLLLVSVTRWPSDGSREKSHHLSWSYGNKQQPCIMFTSPARLTPEGNSSKSPSAPPSDSPATTRSSSARRWAASATSGGCHRRSRSAGRPRIVTRRMDMAATCYVGGSGEKTYSRRGAKGDVSLGRKTAPRIVPRSWFCIGFGDECLTLTIRHQRSMRVPSTARHTKSSWIRGDRSPRVVVPAQPDP